MTNKRNHEIKAPNLETAHEIEIFSTEDILLPNLKRIHRLDVTFSKKPAWLNLDQLEIAGYLVTNSTSINAPLLKCVGNLIIKKAQVKTEHELEFPSLFEANDIEINGLASLNRISFPMLFKARSIQAKTLKLNVPVLKEIKYIETPARDINAPSLKKAGIVKLPYNYLSNIPIFVQIPTPRPK